ncbi:alpha/beta fold hydrolase [Cellulomonas sp. S1-8]|uniref:alpha/beta fold hydrolase n=1 Tax=Cellulomonas sp. S1-8 TaxID=2904790 RepID=UPI00224383FE|nr:alpha/beta hydrolase [Cellulomonas sp. S1-8]UZN04202.1 alpha/beta hydrolase [Cellulomonas sp. S1-8]
MPTRLGVLAVHEHASPDPSAPVALLWHSMFADSSSWAEVVPLLTPHRRLLVVDGPGYGESAPLTRVSSIGESAEAGEAVLDHLGLDSVDWVGNAWGGHAGMHLAATSPERIRTLVTISSPVNALSRSQLRQVRLLTGLVAALGPVRPIRDIIAKVQLVQPRGPHRPVLDAALRRPSRRSVATTVRSFILHRTDLSWALPQIAAPTLVVATEDRYDWTPERAQAYARELPDGAFATIAGTNIVAPLEQPEATAAVVRTFWAERAGNAT